MKLHLLGTSGFEGWPALFCGCTPCRKARTFCGKNIPTRSNALIDDVYKFDFGPDTYHHAITYGLDLGKVEHLVLTHAHADHLNPPELENRFPPFAELADDQPETLHVWGADTALQRIVDVIGHRLEESNRIRLHELRPFEPAPLGDALLTPLPADHDPAQTCFIYLFERGGKRLLYGHDSGIFPDATWDYLSGSGEPIRLDGVLLGCAFGPKPGRTMHLGIEGCLEVQERLQQAGCAHAGTKFIATHFSHGGGLLHDELEQAFGSSGFIVAYDGLVVEI